MVTIDPSIDSVTSLLAEILRALGNKQSGSPWKRQMFALVKKAMVGRRAVLLVDEAKGCTIEMLELLRSLHDNGGHPGGPGICLLGNEELHKTIRSGAGRARHRLDRNSGARVKRVSVRVDRGGARTCKKK